MQWVAHLHRIRSWPVPLRAERRRVLCFFALGRGELREEMNRSWKKKTRRSPPTQAGNKPPKSPIDLHSRSIASSLRGWLFRLLGLARRREDSRRSPTSSRQCRLTAEWRSCSIQHLSPDKESMIAEILSRHTTMSVRQVEDGMSVEPNHVYAIRPGHTLTIHNGALHLGDRVEKPGHSRPVDDFFKSLAEEQRERAISIIMSGMGSNGAAGCQAVKAVGGLCIAQEPEAAQFPSMPRHLIDAGYADYILRVKDMPDVLLGYAGHPYARGSESDAEATLRKEKHHVREILAVLRTRTRQDFSGYKKPTVLRRIQRRMGLNRLTEIGEYAKLLRQSPTEVVALSDDLLIHVTGFFRDAEYWEALRQNVVVPLIAAREPESAVRCWVTACSSGEEAYSLAILLVEEAERISKALDIKVFATDMAERSLQNARGGLYPGGIEADVSPPRLSRFFLKEDAVYRVRPDLRERVVFAPQNVLQDPPFSRLDIVTCRNLLIYLEPDVQHRVLELMHFGLREEARCSSGPAKRWPAPRTCSSRSTRNRGFIGASARRGTARRSFPPAGADRACRSSSARDAGRRQAVHRADDYQGPAR